jgi:gliding motility-associated protein GldC
MKRSEIKFTVELDENNLPQNIRWEASDSNEGSACKSMMVALWDSKENNTLRIDLWTKDMMVDEMKKFYIQNIMTLTDTYLKATGDENTAKKLKSYVQDLAHSIGVLK